MLNDLWDFFWLAFWALAFAAYVGTLFAIVTDLVRDRALHRWKTAIWVAFLMFLPLAAALAYLVVRGPDMAVRAQARALALASQEGASARRSPIDEIETALQLRVEGTLSGLEFEHLKSSVLRSVASET